MRRSSQLSAAQLAALSCLGGIIAASSFFALSTPRAILYSRPAHFIALFTLQLVLLLAGGLIAFRSATSLESGIANDRWPQEEVDALRKMSQSSIANIITFALITGFVLLGIIFPRFRPAGWSLYALLLSLNFLRSSIRPKPSPARESQWANLSPVHSEHWGQH